MKNKIISIMFCLILVAGVVAHVFTADKYYSENEKRTLKQFPTISFENIRSGKFSDEIEKYLADQFPARDGWVSAKTVTERFFGKRESGGVYFADDNYLIEIHKSFSKEQLATNVNAVKQLQDSLSDEGIAFNVMLVPTAGYVLKDKLPSFAPNADQMDVLEYAREQCLNVVDVSAALMYHKDEYIFYRTDHHWTSLGSYYAYAEWMQSKGMQPEPISSWTRETLCDNFWGTTYTKVNFPFAPRDVIDAYYKTITHKVNYNNGYYLSDSIYERKYLDGTDQYATFLNSNQALTVVEGQGQGKLMIIKDSYANCFAQFCIDAYEETHLIDLRYYSGSVQEYIKENGITEVLVLYNIPNFVSDKGVAMCVY